MVPKVHERNSRVGKEGVVVAKKRVVRKSVTGAKRVRPAKN